ncbi:MAG: FtsX-like permease family protein [Pseudomonadales bacterium]
MLKLLLLSQLRFAWRTPLSTLSALLGLTLGIASVVSVHLICERIVASLDQAIPAHLQRISHVATRSALQDQHYFTLRGRWRTGELSQVLALAPLLEGEIAPQDAEDLRVQLRVYGVDWLALFSAEQHNNGSAATPLSSTPLYDQVLVNAAVGWPVGSQRSIGGRVVQVAGEVGASDGPLGDPAVYVDIGLAVDLLGTRSAQRLSAVLLQVDDPLSGLRRLLSRVLPGVEAGLPPPKIPDLGPGWHVQALGSEMPQQSFGRSVLFNLGALGTLSLVVAWFLMFQTALLWLRRQHRVFQLLRDQGVSVHWQFLVFALAMLLLGLVAGLLGVLVGQQLAELLMSKFSVAPATPAATFVLSPWLWLKAALSAILVPLLSAALAYRVARHERGVQLGANNWLRWLGILLATVLMLGLLRSPQSGLFGAFAAILLACIVAVALLMPLIRLLRARWLLPNRTLRGLTLRMGARELLWYPSELGAALGALSLAVATSIGIGTMVDSFRVDFVRMLEQRLADDISIEGPPVDLVKVQLALDDPTTGIGLHWYERARVRVAGQPLVLGRSAMDGRGAARYGLARALEADEVMLNQRAASSLGFNIGDRLTIADQTLRVAHIYPGYGDAELRALVGLQTRLRGESQAAPISFERYRLGVEVAQPQSLHEQLRVDHPQLSVELRSAARARAIAIFDRTFAITRSLTLVALLVAGVGLYSAMVALGLTQSHTRTLMLYLGQRRVDRLLYVSGRALAVALVTVLIAVPLGLLLGAMLCYAVNPRGFGWSVPMTLQWPAILLPVLLALLAAFAAGLVGDRREVA